MENRRAIMWSIAAAVIAGLAYFLAIQKAVDNRVGDLDQKVPVLTATRDIPSGTRIDQTMFVETMFPKAYLPSKVAQYPREIIGQVALATISANEPILTNKLVPFDETSLDRRIPEGMRAITIGIRDDQDVVGVGGLLRPGQFIDILVTHYLSTKEIERGGSGAMADVLSQQGSSLKAEVRTIFQNVQILAVGQDQRIATADVLRNSPGGNQSLTNKNITVALKPADVQILVLAQQTGRVGLSLRRFNDTEIVNLDYLDPFKAFGIKLPVVQGPPPAYREIKGGQVFAAPY